MITKVKDRPYFFVIITRLLKDNLRCLVNKLSKLRTKRSRDDPWPLLPSLLPLFVCFLVLHPYFLFQFFVIVFYTCIFQLYTYKSFYKRCTWNIYTSHWAIRLVRTFLMASLFLWSSFYLKSSRTGPHTPQSHPRDPRSHRFLTRAGKAFTDLQTYRQTDHCIPLVHAQRVN